ncbi:hypothetical protein [Streptomyces viridochromogenes]|uniref:hypothetical protein n=1 Tax=Streptomyces viridochromogenes TaxID=1938 RepID=UPI00069F00E8|nr:hypothetical protein [Streptomyces viridochromogenes]
MWKVGDVAGLERKELSVLLERRRVPRATPILRDQAMQCLAAWNNRLTDSPAAAHERTHHRELTALRAELTTGRAHRRQLQDQVDAAATVIAALAAENAALRAQHTRSSAVIVPFARPAEPRDS